MSKIYLLNCIILTVAFSTTVNCFKDGSLSRIEHVCVTMMPIHPDGSDGTLSPQSGPSPFILMPLQNQVRRGESIGIALTSVMNKTDIRGYYIQARKLEDFNSTTGQFLDYQSHGMYYSCQLEDDTLLHNGTDLKYQPLVFKWIAPDDFTGTVILWATVAESYLRFWTGLYSIPIEVV